MAKRYWVATAGGRWDQTTSWSSTSGGASGASVPTSSDDVIIDANSITSSGKRIDIYGTCYCNNLDATNVLNSPSIAIRHNAGSQLYVYGSFTLPSTVPVVHYNDGGVQGSDGIFFNGSYINVQSYIEVGITFSSGVNTLLNDLSANTSILVSSDFYNIVVNSLLDCGAYNLTSSQTSGDIIINTTGRIVTQGSINNAGGGDIFDYGDVGSSIAEINITNGLNDGTFIVNELSTYTLVNISRDISGVGEYYIEGSGRIETLEMNANGVSFNDIYIITAIYIENVYVQGTRDFLVLDNGSGAAVKNLYLLNGFIGVYDQHIESIVLDGGAEIAILAGRTLRVDSLTSIAAAGSEPLINCYTPSSMAYIEKLKGSVELNNIDVVDITFVGNGIWYKGENTTLTRVYGVTAKAQGLAAKNSTYLKVFDTDNVFIGTIDNLINTTMRKSINTSMNSLQIEIAYDNTVEQNLIEHYNKIELWTVSKDNPDGTIRYSGYIQNYSVEYASSIMTINVSSYGNFLSTSVYERIGTIDDSYTTAADDEYALTGRNLSNAGNDNYIIDEFTLSEDTTISSIQVQGRARSSSFYTTKLKIEVFDSKSSAQSFSSTPLASQEEFLQFTETYWINFEFDTPPTLQSGTYWFRISAQENKSLPAYISHTNSGSGVNATYSNYLAGWSTLSDYVQYKITILKTLTTVDHDSDSLDVIMKEALDAHALQGGTTTYSQYSIEDITRTASPTFYTNTIESVITYMLWLAGQDYYWYIDSATNEIYFKRIDFSEVLQIPMTMIDSISVTKTTIDNINKAYIVGADNNGSNLFISAENAELKALQADLPIQKVITAPYVSTSSDANNYAQNYLKTGLNFNIIYRIDLRIDKLDDVVSIDDLELGKIINIKDNGAGLGRLDSMSLDETYLEFDIADITTQAMIIDSIEINKEVVTLKTRVANIGVDDRLKQEIDYLYTKDNPIGPS